MRNPFLCARAEPISISLWMRTYLPGSDSNILISKIEISHLPEYKFKQSKTPKMGTSCCGACYQFQQPNPSIPPVDKTSIMNTTPAHLTTLSIRINQAGPSSFSQISQNTSGPPKVPITTIPVPPAKSQSTESTQSTCGSCGVFLCGKQGCSLPTFTFSCCDTLQDGKGCSPACIGPQGCECGPPLVSQDCCSWSRWSSCPCCCSNTPKDQAQRGCCACCFSRPAPELTVHTKSRTNSTSQSSGRGTVTQRPGTPRFGTQQTGAMVR